MEQLNELILFVSLAEPFIVGQTLFLGDGATMGLILPAGFCVNEMRLCFASI